MSPPSGSLSDRKFFWLVIGYGLIAGLLPGLVIGYLIGTKYPWPMIGLLLGAAVVIAALIIAVKIDQLDADRRQQEWMEGERPI